MPTVSVIVVSYNTRDLTLGCLASVVEQTRAIDYELIVVDNGSTDGSADAIAQALPSARLIRQEQNVGFARANNLAAEMASGEFLLLLNPDTVVLDHAVEQAVAFAQSRPQVGIVGGRTFFPNMALNHTSCHGRPTPWSLFCVSIGLSSIFRQNRLFDPESLGPWARDTARVVDIVTGCFCLVRRTLWDRLGGFDVDFFMYGEDTDLCIRANNAGSVCMICPDARVLHYGGQSEKVRADKMIRLFHAKSQLFRKHWKRHEIAFGLAMLRVWALSRLTALRMLRRIRPVADGSYQAWREVWRRRGEFA